MNPGLPDPVPSGRLRRFSYPELTLNNANVLVLAEWLTPGQHGVEILETWLNATFGEGFDPQWQKFLKNYYLEIQQMEDGQFK
ncbi:ribose 5-phosphate isomerase RpiB [Candidatus Vecturithrix granuli]|uniref:Ribose 5-phosphate isomerase RpiB n=1 Tax=Vecturithrix granuli TaxID=1499967 RepID=A0A0S6W797_VECG1|nr:ribose 5-phosphate isomerase RpiB [Candidatus Vecturithrix granuli]